MKPNILLITTDQQRADLSRREGFPLDTTPTLDDLARGGTWFNRAYTTAPICVPARVSLLTGRYPSVHRVRENSAGAYAAYERDLVDVMQTEGYATALVGKNHSHVDPDRLDYHFPLGHLGGFGQNRTSQEKAFDWWLLDTDFHVTTEPAPFPVECQLPARAVDAAQQWLRSLNSSPFFMWLSFPEPHNPYQAPEPYFSLFPPETLPPVHADTASLAEKGFKWQWTRHIGEYLFPSYESLIPRIRANYLGMLRLLDDQIQRMLSFLEEAGLLKDTIVVFHSDHGDFAGEYGLVKKGPEMPETLMRIPLLFFGPAVGAQTEPHSAHVSLADVMPSLCEAIGVDLPRGVQGRSLWPLLTGATYPTEEFASAYAEQGVGGLHYTWADSPDPQHCLIPLPNGEMAYDECNSFGYSGTMRMIRRSNWKLVFDMQQHGQLYNLSQDPLELDNLYGNSNYHHVQQHLVTELLGWTLRTQDPLPFPQHGYERKLDPRNYWSSHR